ncbi:MAG TPA: hypothetical protein VFF76_12265 [Holophagaceae bacterium]|jgi:hypothetical protein|nr:hypothetical protein [Holophagaceae bacterium]
MTPREAEQLLGGYATGTLTEAERRVLFAAALEDQTLFNALADEEALRELLADPGARAKLLAALDPPTAHIRPLWRRPGTMALAASLLVAVGVGLLLRHGPAPEAPGVHAPALSEEQPKAAPPSQKIVAASPPPELEEKRSSVRSSPQTDRVPAPPSPLAPITSAENHAALAPMREKAEAKQAPEPPSARAGASIAGAFAFAPGVARDASKVAAAPTWILEAAPAGSFRLKVSWGPEGHLYLLRRDASGVSTIKPEISSLQDGKMESLFTGAVGAGSALDLYLLPEESKVPETLPAEGPAQRFRHRIWPVEK